MSKIRDAGFFEVPVGGVKFRLRRRSTLVMAQARGLMAVAGQVAGANAKGEEATDQQAAEFMRSVLEVAVYEVDEGDGWQLAADVLTPETLAPFSDVLCRRFMDSALQVDPTPPAGEA